ncbi:dihydroxyacetone kinase subunit DhaL [Pseudoramibacter alactolyticus]
MAVTKADILAFIKAADERIEAHHQELTDLDQAIGDGDHGINMNRGFKAVMEKLPGVEDKAIDVILKQVGMTLVSTVGGASGPLYGTAYMRAGMAMKGKETLAAEDISAMFEAAIGGIQQRGKAVAGEKTMLDAVMPAKEAYDAGIAAGKSIAEALADAEDAAWKGVAYTKTIIATKGRASYLGERSIGHQDPGATSITYMVQAARAVAEAK